MNKLEIELQIFGKKAKNASGLTKAKYLEQMKGIQKKMDQISWAIHEIKEKDALLQRKDFILELNKLLNEMNKVTEAEKQKLLNIFR